MGRQLLSPHLALLAALTAAPAIAAAESAPPPLETGQSYADVLSRWGAPAEKIEMETRRRDIWRYPAGQAVFQNGKVVSWTLQRRVPTVAEAPARQSSVQAAAKKKRTSATDNPNLLDEILNELPSEGPVPSGPGGAPNMPPRG